MTTTTADEKNDTAPSTLPPLDYSDPKVLEQAWKTIIFDTFLITTMSEETYANRADIYDVTFRGDRAAMTSVQPNMQAGLIAAGSPRSSDENQVINFQNRVRKAML